MILNFPKPQHIKKNANTITNYSKRLPAKLYSEQTDFPKWSFNGKMAICRRFIFCRTFFEGVIQKSKQLEENKQEIPVMTSLETLSEIAEKMPHIAPDAFIFHVSLCGSMLMTQLLGLDERNVVVSEPSILDEALRELAFKINTKNGFDPNLQATIRMIGRRAFTQRFYGRYDWQ